MKKAQSPEKKRKKYLIGHLAGTKLQCEYLADLTDNDDERRFVCHLVANSIFCPRWQSDEVLPYVPVHHSLIPGGAATIEALVKKGLIDVDRHYIQPTKTRQGKTRTYQISPTVLINYIKEGLSDESLVRYNVVSGKRIRSQLKPTTERGQTLGRCYYNKVQLLDDLDELTRITLAAPTKQNRARHLVATRCVHTMVRGRTSRPEPELGEGIWSYTPEYVVTGPGRRSELGGGAQGLPGNLKICLNLPGFYNYDLESAQVRGMRRINSAINVWHGYTRNKKAIKSHYLDWWLDMPKTQKEMRAVELGVSYDLLKKLVYAMMFGAGSNYIQELGLPEGTERAVEDFLQPLRSYVHQIHKRLTEMLRERAANRWKTGIGTGLPAWARKVLTITAQGNGVHVINAVGRTIHVMDARGQWIKDDDGRDWYAGRVLAHLLQGLEADFVDRLADGLQQHGVVVCSLQYDGLITKGAIPRDILGKVTAKCAMGSLAKLSEGPFKRKAVEVPKTLERELTSRQDVAERVARWRAEQLAKMQEEAQEAMRKLDAVAPMPLVLKLPYYSAASMVARVQLASTIIRI